MRVFVTGASGHVASAVIPELLSHGHQVLGLARSEEGAAKVRALGAEVRRGDLTDTDGLAAAAAECDGVIHLAFRHDVAFKQGDFATAAASDRAAIAALGEALAGTGKPFVGTGGSMVVAHAVSGRAALESDFVEAGPNPRFQAENQVVALAGRGVRSAVVRLAPLVHSELDKHGFIAMLIGLARENGFAAYIGQGTNLWPGLNTHDAGPLYRLALEQAPAGSRLHGVESEGITFREISEAIAARLGLEARSVTPEQAAEKLGFLAMFAPVDNPTSNEWTRQTLGWQPTHPDLLADIAAGHYFA